ncbi:MAG: DUF4956 domain-containing protein [Clostridia bacterium]|nr:DUF4956 domain-containing protein [Clostridia bacterium]
MSFPHYDLCRRRAAEWRIKMEEILTSTASGAAEALSLTIPSALAAIAAAIIFGIVIALTYKFTHGGGHQQSFALTLTMLPVILAVIILFIGSNVARAFSLAGTLSIIRFRSAPGDPKDIAYIFFSIAAGLAAGVGMYFYGALFVAVLCIFMIILTKINFAANSELEKTLKITVPENLDYEGAFEDILQKYTDKTRLTRIKTTDLGSLYELCYSVRMKNNTSDREFIDELRCRNGNLNIVLDLASDTVYGK